MKLRGLTTSLFALVLVANAIAEEPADVRELERRNAELEKRVQQLERKQLDKEIETYLDDAQPFTEAQGDPMVWVQSQGAKAIRVIGQIRVRGEVRDHLYTDDRPNAGKSFNIVRMRTRLGVEADVLENLGVTIEFQDVRYFGEALTTVGVLERVDTKRAFIDFRNIGGKPVDVQVGRMVVWYGDQRLIGHLEWVDQGRMYDGIRVQIHPEKWFLDAFAFNITDAVPSEAANQYFYGIYGGPKWCDFYFLGRQNQADRAGETGVVGKTLYWTAGARLHGSRGAFDYKVEVPVQFGELNGDDLTAWGIATTWGWNFEDAKWSPRVYAEVNYASGDNDPTDGKVKQLQTLFPTNHLFYGFADQVGWENLFEIRIGVLLKPAEKWRVRVDWHHFRRPEEEGNWVGAAGRTIRSGATGTSSHLGDEVDLVVAWLPAKPLSLHFGWAIFLPGSFIEETGDSPTSHYIWLQCRVQF
ncbi:MAG: alginate export family protein [Planctomycetota bacterium]